MYFWSPNRMIETSATDIAGCTHGRVIKHNTQVSRKWTELDNQNHCVHNRIIVQSDGKAVVGLFWLLLHFEVFILPLHHLHPKVNTPRQNSDDGAMLTGLLNNEGATQCQILPLSEHFKKKKKKSKHYPDITMLNILSSSAALEYGTVPKSDL